MKLYTERQMKEMFRIGWAHSINEDGALNQFAPIELPTDEDEEKDAFKLTKNLQQHMGFNIGVKWIRDKIQGGNQ